MSTVDYVYTFVLLETANTLRQSIFLFDYKMKKQDSYIR